MKNIYIIIISILFAHTVFAQSNRNVLWLHGLGSNADSWQDTPAEFSNSYYINSLVGSYPSGLGVKSYSQRVRNAFNNESIDNILIGQSMGGVVSRDILIHHPNYAGGMISLGSPLNGAFISNSKKYNRVLPTLEDGYNILKSGPLLSYGGTVVLMVRIVNLFNENDTNFSFEDLNTLLLDQFRERLPGIATSGLSQAEEDLTVKSTYMLDVMDKPINKPHLAIWGEEYAPVSINYAATLISQHIDTLNNAIPLDFDVIHGMSKAQLNKIVNAASDVYNAHEVYYYLNIPNVWVPGAYYKSQLWRDGKNYLRTKLEDDWNYLIGTNRTDYYQQACYEEIICNWEEYFEDGLGALPKGDGPTLPGDCMLQTVCPTVSVRINSKSDGYIDATSQQGQLYTQKPTATERALGVNHHELYFHETSRNIIRNAFAGQHGDFFFTTER